ncbi:MAG: hypothetical protein U0359_10425 [Byssovorax sp.]
MRPGIALRAARALLPALALTACGARAPDPVAEAEALLAKGEREDAARRFELVCAIDPGSSRCHEAERRAAQIRIDLADEALATSRFLDAEAALHAALTTASGPEQAAVEERLGRAELTAGLRWARAIQGDPSSTTLHVAEEIGAMPVPVAAEARAFLAREAPRAAIAAVNAACGPAHRSSCARARAALDALSATGPEADEARALADAESKRVAPLLTRAEEQLLLFAAEGKRRKVLERCLNARLFETADQGQLRETCEEQAYGDDPPEELYRRRRNLEALFRRNLAAIADPALTEPLAARRASALAEGVVKRPEPLLPPGAL